MVMSWMMNSVQPQIASTITYYTTAKEMWDFLRQTYSQDKNVSKILQVEEELHNLRQGNQDLSQYFATVKATYERLKFLRPPCKSCYKSHFEPTMVAKFLAGLSPEYATAKDQMLTGSEIPDLSDAYNRLSRLAISLSQPTGVTPASALAVGGGRSHGSTYSARGRGMGRGTGGRGRFQCTYCGKIGHLEDCCWDKHGRPSSLSQGRNMVTKQGKSPAYLSMGSAQTATPTLEESSPSIASQTVSIDKAEYEQFFAHKASQASASTVVTDRAFSAGPSASDSDARLSPMSHRYGYGCGYGYRYWYGYGHFQKTWKDKGSTLGIGDGGKGMAGGRRDSSGLKAEAIAENVLLDVARFRTAMLREAGETQSPLREEDEREEKLQPQPEGNAGEAKKRRRHNPKEDEDEEEVIEMEQGSGILWFSVNDVQALRAVDRRDQAEMGLLANCLQGRRSSKSRKRIITNKDWSRRMKAFLEGNMAPLISCGHDLVSCGDCIIIINHLHTLNASI
ncbi:hypothetical protein EJ110_NYTH29416 [Nymphaea thermarum]|nr:hypothetical protein EJ110_NYTH29416 [Nymphaea thermarum]